jgi:uncharacterized protein YraI
MRSALAIPTGGVIMPAATQTHRPLRPGRVIAISAAIFALLAPPAVGLAQTVTDPVYAVSELNLRKGPGESDAVFTVIPLGAELQRREGSPTNAYVPVTFNGVNGWVIESGLVASPQEVELANTPASSDASLELFSPDARVTLAPLMLRSGPDTTAEPIAGMPEGSLVTLTREGWQNGYVTVDYGGARGWAFADLLARPDEVS